MALEIGKVKLTKIHRLETLEDTSFVYHNVPGKEGSAVQNMGRPSVRLGVEGIFYGPRGADDMKALREVHLKREPVDFIADILEKAYVGKVVLDKLEIWEDASFPSQFSYSLVLAEYIEPPKAPGGATALVEAGIKVDAQNLVDLASLPDALALGAVPEVTNPLEPLNSALDPVREAAKSFTDSMQALKDLL